MSGNIKVVVRCRPLNEREKTRGATSIIRMSGNQTIITNNKKATTSITNNGRQHHQQDEGDNVKAFTFDRSYWSADRNDDHYADQELVYNDLGRELLDHAFDGYNCCIFAYGQTGSGKSYSMMGYGEDKGIIPRTCSELFERIIDLTSDMLTFQVEVSYIEIYNEKVRDLLNPGNKGNLKVREHPTIGPYVEDLSRLVVKSFDDIDHLMNEGNKARTVAATQMNETSSRSHAVFTIFLTSNRFDATANLNTEKIARISLVDLAGSERANSTGATGARLKEGANINKSLTTLGKVIAALAESSSSSHHKQSTSNHNNFIPYRDSVLTWLLKDSLGGNSKTAMIAAISPADYDETLSTLRYADQAKRIKNKPVVNEDPNARLIRELKEELQALRDTLMIYAPAEEVEKIIQQQKKSGGKHSRTSSRATSVMSDGGRTTSPMLLLSPESPLAAQRGGNGLLTKEQVIEQLQCSEKLLSQINQTWEEKMSKTEDIHRQRENALKELGVIVEKDNMGVYAPKTIHLINLNEDPLMTECLMYQIKPGVTRVGKLGSKVAADIRLSGNEIMEEHCYFENTEQENSKDNRVTIYPGEENSVTLVNGLRINSPKVLRSGYRIIFGSGLHHLFRFNHPDQVRREREQLQQGGGGIVPAMTINTNDLSTMTSNTAVGSPTGSTVTPQSAPPPLTGDEIVDWKFAHSEALLKFGSVTANPSDLTVMTDEDLKHLSDGITKVREFRNRKRISSECHQPLIFDENEMVSPRTSISSSSIITSHNKRFSTVSSAPTVLTDSDGNELSLSREENEKLVKEAIEDMQHQLNLQKQEYENKLILVESSNLKTEEINKERNELLAKYTQIKEEMEKSLEQQKLAYENKIKRISAHLPPGTALSSDNLLVGFTSKNATQQLLRRSVDKWCQLKYVKMAEDCLIHAVVLKEANIMAKELGKNAVYQFTVVHDDISSNPLSFWESTSALQPFTREPDTHLMQEKKPCLAVQVIDHVHRVTYIWSIMKLKHRLRRMRRLYDYTDRPLFTGQHFNREDPFYETPCPRYTLIGLARVPLRNLTLQLHADSLVDVYNRNTTKVMGQIRVLITPIARSISRKNQTSSRHQQQGEKYLLHIGQQQVFEIRIQEFIGLNESEFTQIHAQFRLSSFGNVERYSSADKIYQTDPISGFGSSGRAVFNQCQTLSVHITENMMDVILDQGLTIEVYGQAQESHLYELVEHVSNGCSHLDDNNIGSPTTAENTWTDSILTQKAVLAESATAATVGGYTVPASRRFSLHRRFSLEKSIYDGILMEERHDVLAQVEICELDSDGEYAPVSVSANGVFCLKQGLQRRVTIKLQHDSGKQLEWSSIQNVTMGQIRLVDSKGRLTDSPTHAPVEIYLLGAVDQTGAIEFERNGISRMIVQGPWDSSLHDSLFLNRITNSGQSIRLKLSWQVKCDKCVAPLCFDMDISVQIGGRSGEMSSSSSMFRLLSKGSASSNASSKKMHSGMFIVQLKPPMTKQVRELWRLNTANKYVRGEEFIGSWKPRGVSLITDYRAGRQKMILRDSVTALRHALLLEGHPRTKVIQRSNSIEYNMNGEPSLEATMNTASDDSMQEKKKRDPQETLKKTIDLWKTQFSTSEEIIFSQDPPQITSLTHSSSTASVSSIHKNNLKIKLTADIQQLHPSDTVTKKGYLLHPKNVDETWLKHWFVLRRPFIMIYQDNTETEELGVLNLTSARVDYKSDLEEMLERKYTFAIYTNNNAYLFQASDFDEMKDWISKVDQFYPVQKLDELQQLSSTATATPFPGPSS